MDPQRMAETLAADEAVAKTPGLAELGAAAFAYASVLLDDDDHLTKLGNPTGEARAKLRARIEEMLTGSVLDSVELDEGEE